MQVTTSGELVLQRTAAGCAGVDPGGVAPSSTGVRYNPWKFSETEMSIRAFWVLTHSKVEKLTLRKGNNVLWTKSFICWYFRIGGPQNPETPLATGLTCRHWMTQSDRLHCYVYSLWKTFKRLIEVGDVPLYLTCTVKMQVSLSDQVWQMSTDYNLQANTWQ